jgi:hypothetical protein
MSANPDEETVANPSLVMIQKLCSMTQIKFHSLAQANGSSVLSHLSFCIPNMGEMVMPLPKPACSGQLSSPMIIEDCLAEKLPVMTINN